MLHQLYPSFLISENNYIFFSSPRLVCQEQGALRTACVRPCEITACLGLRLEQTSCHRHWNRTEGKSLTTGSVLFVETENCCSGNYSIRFVVFITIIIVMDVILVIITSVIIVVLLSLLLIL